MGKEEILAALYGTVVAYERVTRLVTPFEPEQYKGKLATELIDADAGRSKLPRGERMTRGWCAGCATRGLLRGAARRRRSCSAAISPRT